MIYLTQEERHFRNFMGISAITYFIAGLAFFLAPNLILKAINLASRILIPSLPPIPLAVEKFWLTLAFSMMMTITAICYLVRLNVRKNIHLTLPLLIAKATSSLSALFFSRASSMSTCFFEILSCLAMMRWFSDILKAFGTCCSASSRRRFVSSLS